MEIRPTTANRTRPAEATLARPAKVTAPAHPLADADGQVPSEVFDLPPELMAAIRTVPIRAPELSRPAPPPRAVPLGSPTFEVDL